MQRNHPDQITLRGIEVFATHGVYAEEKTTPQLFIIDVSCDLASPVGSDELTQTVDYSELALTIAEAVRGETVDLIETLAQRVADTCLRDPKIASVTVTVHKPQAPIAVPVADVSVTIVRGR